MEMPFNFHDAVVISCKLEENNWTLLLHLYEVFYPGKKDVQIFFKDIYNLEKLMSLQQAMIVDELEYGWNGTRINALKYDTKKTSTATDHYIYLDADGYNPVTIHCLNLAFVQK